VAVLGLVNAGKSSLINALSGRSTRAVGPTSGTTLAVEPESWTTVETPAGPFLARLVDTPGLEDIDHPDRGEQARAAARRADLILFVTEEDLTASALRVLRGFHAWGKPLVVAVNKADLHDPAESEAIASSIRGRLAGLVDPGHILTVSAAPRYRVRVQTDSSSHVAEERGEPEVGPLLDCLGEALSSSPELKALRDASDQIDRFVAAEATGPLARRALAERAADETALGLALALAINPIPLFDLLAAPAGLALLARRVARAYDCSITPEHARELASEVLRGGRARLWGTLAGAGAGSLLKLVPGLGHAAGAIATGSCAGLFLHILGRSLIEYFDRGETWGEAGLEATLDAVASRTDRVAVARGLADQLRDRLRDRIDSRPSHWLDPRGWWSRPAARPGGP
jgi:small GTP-binding protein